MQKKRRKHHIRTICNNINQNKILYPFRYIGNIKYCMRWRRATNIMLNKQKNERFKRCVLKTNIRFDMRIYTKIHHKNILNFWLNFRNQFQERKKEMKWRKIDHKQTMNVYVNALVKHLAPVQNWNYWMNELSFGQTLDIYLLLLE